MKDKILAEIAQLDTKIAAMKEQLVLADGCRQGLKWVVQELDLAEAPQIIEVPIEVPEVESGQ